MTKAQAKRRCKEVIAKCKAMFTCDHMSTKDMVAIEKIMNANLNRLMK